MATFTTICALPNKAGTDYAPVKKRIREIVYAEVNRLQGSISAEHGVGVERKTELQIYKSPVALAAMKTLKKGFDPDNIMNPGKIFD